MHSPKFPAKVNDLKDVVNVPRLKAVWKNKIRDALRRQAVPDPIEYLDFHISLDAACTALEAEVLSGAYIPSKSMRLLSEKSKGLCRQIVIPSAKDALLLQTLSDALWVELKKKAPSPKSFYAPQDQKFANKVIKGHTDEYGSVSPWLSFQETIFGFAKTKDYMVVTDIANYYDFISYDHLRNILADLSIAREHALDLLLYILSGMLWQPDYMPRVPIGLPQMNLDAPRLLAHCFLFEIDALLHSDKTIDFTRFMDDMDIGVDTESKGRQVLRDLDLALQTRQIRLNSGKSRILPRVQASRHFKIRENELLDKLDIKISTAGASVHNAKLVSRLLRLGFRSATFSDGVGDKILKRLINYASITRAKIDRAMFTEVFYRYPSCRESLLRWYQQSEWKLDTFKLIDEILNSGFICDDATVVDIAVALVNTRIPAAPLVVPILSNIVAKLPDKDSFGFFAKLWMLSKYGTRDELMTLVESRVSVWVAEEYLSRCVAGLVPRFIGTTDETKFRSILTRSANSGSAAVLSFYKELEHGTDGYLAIAKFLNAPNKTLPNKITHSKYLMLVAALKNPSLAGTTHAKLTTTHSIALSDPFYKAF